MPRNSNPFEVVESVGKIIVIVLVTVVYGGALGLIVLALVTIFGWWTILVIPGLIVLLFLSALGVGFLKWLGYKWQRAKIRWEENQHVSASGSTE